MLDTFRDFVNLMTVPMKVPAWFTGQILGQDAGGLADTLAEMPGRVAKTVADTTSNALLGLGSEPARVPLDPFSRDFREELFDNRLGWKPLVRSSIVASRYKIAGTDRIFAESHFSVAVPRGKRAADVVRALVAEVRQPWNFYGGKVTDYKHWADGRITYDLFPTGFGLKVYETMGRPLDMRDGRWRIPVMLQGAAHGLAYLEIVPRGDRVDFYGRFAGVQPGGLGNLFGTEGYVKNHLLGEDGLATKIPFLGALLHDGGGLMGLFRSRGYRLLPPT
jgi:hypothetical protein